MQEYQVAVVGLGALGSASAYHLARRGVSVVGFEQFPLGHVRGASHDSSRILRYTYHRPEYVRLARAAYRDWRELEAASGQQLVTASGGLTFFPSDGTQPLAAFTDSLDAGAVPFEVFTAYELARRWPQFNLARDVVSLWQPDTASVPASRTTALLQVLARAAGAELHDECRVIGLEPRPGGVEVRLGDRRVFARRVLLCAAAWTNQLLAPLGAELALTTTLEQVSYFQPPAATSFETGRFPVWIWESDPCYYGFPMYGEQTIKAARDHSGVQLDVDRRTFTPDAERLAELDQFLSVLLRDHGTHVRTVTCQYTLTPDRAFAIGPVPGAPDILTAVGAGHAFKFAPTIGRILADLATSGRCSEDIGLFDPAHAALSSAQLP